MATTIDNIRDAVDEFRPLFDRMDKDRDLYNMISYQLKDLETGKAAKDVVNITMNDPRVFADRAQAFMAEASMQTLVEGNHLQDADSTLIENFDRDIRYEIDMLLMPRRISGLFNFLIEQAVIRGTLAGRPYSWQNKEEKFVPELLPCDSRYLVYEYGLKELELAAFRTVRTRSMLERDYPEFNDKFIEKRYAIWEHWDKKICELWMTPNSWSFESAHGIKIGEKENPWGYVPFIIEGVGAGSMLQDEGAIAYNNESIFSNNRLLYEHLNMLGSILQTLNYLSFNRVHLWESEAGTAAKHPPKPGVRKTIPIDKGTKGLFPVQVEDVNQATRLFYSLLLGAVQRGSLPNIDYGNLTFPLSAVAISRLSQTKDAIFSPRLNAIAWFYRKLHYMIKDQYVKGKYNVELGEEGMKRKYDSKSLDIDYRMSYKFHAVSPEQDIANYAVAAQARAIGISRHTTFSKILKFDNPEGEIMKADAEDARKLDPIIMLFDHAHAIINEGTDRAFLKADIIGDQIELLIKKRYAPEIPAGEGVGGNGKMPPSMIPLLEGGGGKGTPMNQDELQNVAPEEMLNREERRAETVRKSEAEG